jgi:suppressor for copper-sensitivity B
MKKICLLILIFLTSFTNIYANNLDLNKVSLLEDDKNNLAIEINLQPGSILYSYDVAEVGRKPIFNISSNNFTKFSLLYPQSNSSIISGYQVNYYENNIIIPLIIASLPSDQKINFTINMELTICNESCNIEHYELSYPENVKKISSNEIIDAINAAKITVDENVINIANKDSENNMLLILLYALIGGVILNFMPCVLPVISLKILSLMKIENKKTMKLSIISMIAGVIISFLTISFFTIFAKISGESVGIGFHFQNIYFLLFLYIMLILMAIYILNNWTIILPKWLDEIINKRKLSFVKYSDSFLIGVLTVIFAMPCTAPYLCIATSYAVTAPNFMIILIFIFIGLGLSMPFLLLLFVPNLFVPNFVHYIPKSGKWLGWFKKTLAILIIFSALWMLYLIYILAGIRVSLFVFGISLLLKFCLEQNKYFLKYFSVKLILVIILIASIFTLPKKIEQQNAIENSTYNYYWHDFTKEKLVTLKTQKKNIIINFTASWCLTCKVNQYLVFHNDAVIKFLESKNIVGMVSDLSNDTPQDALDIMNHYGRKEIPLTIFFSDKLDKAIILPIILTPANFIEEIERLL